MARRRGCNLILGLALILLGGWFLASQYYPNLLAWVDLDITWPLTIVGVGVFLLLFGLAFNAPGMAVPASVVGGIGGLLYWQNATGNWDSWSYAWALIPGFVGVGVILAGILEGRPRQALGGGGTLVIISLVLFSVFSSFMGGPRLLGDYWPVLLIVIGLWMLVSVIFRR